MDRRRIVISGIGVVSCYGTCVESFFQSLLLGKSGVQYVQEWVDLALPTQFGAIVQDFVPTDVVHKKEARRLEKGIVYALSASRDALSDSQLNLREISPERIGVLIGSGMGGVQTFVRNIEGFTQRSVRGVSPFFIPHILSNMAGAKVAIHQGLLGPNYGISAACATANYACIAAANHIRQGEADIMLAGGVDASITPACVAGFGALKALSTNNTSITTASCPWDRNRKGFVIGEGCGVLVLETLEHALARNAPIYAEYLGGATSMDGYHMTRPAEEGVQLSRCMAQALQNAQRTPQEIDVINAHATSTQAGDLCEIRALKRLFGEHLARIPLHATKSLMGHALGAAGAFEAIALALSLRKGLLHPTINLQDPEPEVQGLNLVAGEAQGGTYRCGISNSSGFGGHNSCIVLSRYE